MRKSWLGALVLSAAWLMSLGTADAQTSRGEESRRDSSRSEEREDRTEGRRSTDLGRFFGRETSDEARTGESESDSGWLSDWWGGEERRDRDESGASMQDRIRSGVSQFLSRHDRNRDGYLAKNEVPNALRQGFDRVDQNRDGYLSASELRQRAHMVSTGRSPVLFTGLWIIDAQRGKIDADELQQAYDIMQRMDEDNDGKITRDELQENTQRVASRLVDRCFQKLDQNDDDQITRNEVSGSPFAQRFAEFDEDQDNRLTRNEIRDAIENPQVATRIRERFESSRGESGRR